MALICNGFSYLIVRFGVQYLANDCISARISREKSSMAILENSTKRVEVSDGASGLEVRDAARELNVPFSCTRGVCGTCVTEIEAVMENLSPRSEREAHLNENARLLCQVRINGGTVRIQDIDIIEL